MILGKNITKWLQAVAVARKQMVISSTLAFMGHWFWCFELHSAVSSGSWLNLQWYNSNDQHLDSKWWFSTSAQEKYKLVSLPLALQTSKKHFIKNSSSTSHKSFKVNKEFLMHRFGAYFFWRGVCIICCISWILEKSKKFDGRHQRSHFTWAERKPQTAFI